MVIAPQVQGKIVLRVEEVIEVTIPILHTLHLIIHHLIEVLLAETAEADKVNLKQGGHQQARQYSIHPQKLELLLQFVKTWKRDLIYLTYEMFFFVMHGMIEKIQRRNYMTYLNLKV